MPRRGFLRFCAACISGIVAVVSGWAAPLRPQPSHQPLTPPGRSARGNDDDFDFIVVGSGAGGGPLAVNLARAGFKVLLLEAGGDDESYDYQVPAFHVRASEDERLRWDFFVRHYSDEAQQKRDEKFRSEHNGVFYPRSGTLGGCTAHNALIVVYPHNSDWDYIATLTGDGSWHSDTMRGYFERLERCEYVHNADTASRHGFKGWLTTHVADPSLLVHDELLQKLTWAALKESFFSLGRPFTRVLQRLGSHFDPNDWRLVKQSSEGICVTPLCTHAGKRIGSREYIRRAQQACPDHLVVKTHALATRVILDDNQRAIGVEYLAGKSLYRADPRFREHAPAAQHTALAKREVILCAGAFNTPQLLKLSGIGPKAELQRHGILVKVDLPGVGENLQDRYEIGVIIKLKEQFALLKGTRFRAPKNGEEPDPQFRQWLQGTGPYTSNGAVVALIKRSAKERLEPDLFLFGLLGFFKGYFPGYSNDIARNTNFFTWAVLKAHTNNTAGQVTLRSNDPRDVPNINFHYFDEGTDKMGDDLESIVSGVETVRRITARCKDVIEEEVLPGADIDTREKLRQFVKDNAWGHHASCTCKMGPASDSMAVVDSRFRVHGTRNLRVVDASVFPKIPGFFIVTSVYMIGEKASDVIIADAKSSLRG
jgi:choline dehydrogenase